MERDCAVEPQLPHHVPIPLFVRAFTNDVSLGRGAVLQANVVKRFNEKVRSLQVSQHSDIEEIGGCFIHRNGGEFVRCQPVVDNARTCFRVTDLAFVGCGFIVGHKDQPVGQAAKEPFQRVVDPAFEAIGIIVQAAAMRAIDAGGFLAAQAQNAADQARIGATFCPVSMQDVGFQVPDVLVKGNSCRQILYGQLTLHGKACNTKS